jgi:hypothetical protein
MDIEPDITEVTWGKTINIGNFENVRLDLKARVNEGQDWREVLRAIRHLVRDYEIAIRKKYQSPPE